MLRKAFAIDPPHPTKTTAPPAADRAILCKFRHMEIYMG